MHRRLVAHKEIRTGFMTRWLAPGPPSILHIQDSKARGRQGGKYNVNAQDSATRHTLHSHSLPVLKHVTLSARWSNVQLCNEFVALAMCLVDA